MLKHTYTISPYIILALCILFFLLPEIVRAEVYHYVPFVQIPDFDYSANSLPDLINRVYRLLIVVGCLFAVVKITLAGLKWSLSDIVSNKHDAMHDIQGVALGLALLLTPALVLSTINKDLVDLNVLKSFGESLEGIDLEPSQSTQPLPAHLQKKTCVPKGDTPEDIEACFTELNCPPSPDMRAGISREGDTITCVYTPLSQRVSGTIDDTCRMATDNPSERKRCLDELNCLEGGRDGDISIVGKAMTCTYAPRYEVEECHMSAETSSDECMQQCAAKPNGVPKPVPIPYGTGYNAFYYECKYVAN